MDIKILGSPCAVSDYYVKQIEKITKKLNIEVSITKIEDEEIIETYGVQVNCLFGYCPGCHSNNKDNGEKNVPALIINGTLAHHSFVPLESELLKILEDSIQSTSP